jgi:hypothetical protein
MLQLHAADVILQLLKLRMQLVIVLFSRLGLVYKLLPRPFYSFSLFLQLNS